MFCSSTSSVTRNFPSISSRRRSIRLTQLIRATDQFQKADAADRLLKIATGDGTALVFYTGPDGPVRCAMELSQALKNDVKLQLRMGIHSGPVRDVTDVAGHTNLAERV